MKYLLNGEKTKRLKFRLLLPEDFEVWVEMFREQQVARLLGVEDIPTPYEQCKNWFDKMEYRYKNDLGGMNVLVDKFTNKLIGQSGLLVQEVDGEQYLEVAYSILPKYWNQGYATEAAQKCRDHAFGYELIDNLISIIHKENLISEKVAKKNGMKFIKSTIFREKTVNIFGITRMEWGFFKNTT